MKKPTVTQVYEMLSPLVPDRYPTTVADDKAAARVLWNGPFVVVPNGNEKERFVAVELGAATVGGDAVIQFTNVFDDRPVFVRPASVQRGDGTGTIKVSSSDPNSWDGDLVVRPLTEDDSKFFVGEQMPVDELVTKLIERGAM